MATVQSQLTALTTQFEKLNKDLIADTASKQDFGFDNANQTVNTLSAGVSAFGSISSALVGFKSIELAEEELDLKKDQYKTAQQEFDRVAKVKSSLARRF